LILLGNLGGNHFGLILKDDNNTDRNFAFSTTSPSVGGSSSANPRKYLHKPDSVETKLFGQHFWRCIYNSNFRFGLEMMHCIA